MEEQSPHTWVPRKETSSQSTVLTRRNDHLTVAATESWRKHHLLLTLSLEMKKKGRVSATINRRERTAPWTSQPPSPQTLPSTSVLWRHSALQISEPYPNSKAERHHVFSSLSFHIHLSLSSGRWDSFDQLKYIPNDAFQKLFKFKIFPADHA